MMLFSRRNLFYDDYLWTEYPKGHPKVSGRANDTAFDPKEGNEVVYLINTLMNLWSYRFSNTGNKMEKLIRERLPENLRTQEEVRDWLQANLKF